MNEQQLISVLLLASLCGSYLGCRLADWTGKRAEQRRARAIVEEAVKQAHACVLNDLNQK